MRKRTPDLTPFETWEFYQFVKKAFGATYLNKLFSISSTQIARWCRNPEFEWGDKAAKNPIDRYEIMLQDLVDEGFYDIARLSVARQARIVGCILNNKALPEPDKATLELEILDDTEKQVPFEQALLNPSSTQGEVEKTMNEYIEDIKEDYVLRCRKSGWPLPGLPGDLFPDPEARKEIAELKNKIAELEAELNKKG